MLGYYRSNLVKEAEAARREYLRELFGNFFRNLRAGRGRRVESHS